MDSWETRMIREAIHKYIDGQVDEHVANIQEWVRQSSVSWDDIGYEDVAKLAARTYKKLSCHNVEVLEGRFYPGVWAFYDAGATIDMRFVIEMSPGEIVNALPEHLDKRGFTDIDIDIYAAFSNNLTRVSAPASLAMLMNLKQYKLNYTVWPIQAGGGPWTVIPNMYNVSFVRGGSIGGGAACPVDEYYVIEGDGIVAGMVEAEKYLIDLLYNLAHTLITQIQEIIFGKNKARLFLMNCDEKGK